MKITIKGIEFEVPDWTKWVAQDEDGQWYAYDMEPILADNEWALNPEANYCDKINMKAEDWKNSLEMIKNEA